MLVVSGEEINIKRSSGAGDDSGPEVRRCGTGTNTKNTGAPFAGSTGAGSTGITGTGTTWYRYRYPPSSTVLGTAVRTRTLHAPL